MPDPSDAVRPPVSKSATRFVGGSGLGMVIVAAVGQFTDHDAATNITFAVVGAATIVVTPLLGRLTKFEFSATAASADFGPAEAQVKSGQVVDAVAAVHEVDAALSGEGTLSAQVEVGPPTIARDVEKQPRVLMTRDALDSYRRLSADDRTAVGFALAKLEGARDPRAIESVAGSQFYYVRNVDDRVQLYYRQLDKVAPEQPMSYVVLAVESTA